MLNCPQSFESVSSYSSNAAWPAKPPLILGQPPNGLEPTAIQTRYTQIAAGTYDAISIQFLVPKFGPGAVGVAVKFISQQVSSYW
jgi:hypothetical protein